MLVSYDGLFDSLVAAWASRNRGLRAVLVATGVLIAVGGGMAAFAKYSSDPEFVNKLGATIAVVAAGVAASIAAYQNFIDQQVQRQSIERVEEEARNNPEKPQLAWDLARTKLESYLDRNLSQVKSIYVLTSMVMAAGFALILYGLFQAFQNPDKLPVSIVASASGVLVSFIGGSFLLIYRSILSQSKDYVTVLERINAVGMAVQVISNIPDDRGALRDQTTAELAKQLLGMYGSSTESKPAVKRIPAKPKPEV